MQSIASSVVDYYNDILHQRSDPRVKGLFLMDSPLPILIIGITYYHFIRYSGPRLMKDKKPFQLERIMVVYNTIQVIINAWAVGQGIKVILHPQYSLFCSPTTYDTSPFHMKTTVLSWIYFLIKVLDLADTRLELPAFLTYDLYQNNKEGQIKEMSLTYNQCKCPTLPHPPV